ncbi:MAG: MBL fold metallo-hydrolase [bacterium]|nr:MBL fold metallo-hydrolase [bacterium]
MAIRIVYDNVSARGDMPGDWGFSALVDFRGERVLFDSGADGNLFLKNLSQLSIQPTSIQHALISHQHSDHREGIHRLALKNRTMNVFYLDAFPPAAFELAMAVGMSPVRVTGPRQITDGVYTTGVIAGNPPEQSLIFETAGGLVVLTGCSHPGVVKLIEAAREQRQQQKVRLLLGGFHMLRQSEELILEQIARLKELGVEQVAPAHCTGERAKKLFRRAWGPNYVAAGAGRRIVVR